MITITRYPKDYEISDHNPAVLSCRKCNAEWVADNNSYITHYDPDTFKVDHYSARCPFCLITCNYNPENDPRFRLLDLRGK